MKITHCKLKKSIQKKLLEFFMLEVTARSAADLLVIQPNSAILFYRKIREVISYHLALEADEVFDGQIELDESYFDGTRKGKRGRGAVGKTAVFGLLKRDGKVYTVVVPNTQSATLLPIIREKVKPDSIVYTDFYRSYDVLDVSEFNHFRINHSTH
ncbi:IS1595 family transposase, partial [Glaesserella parasuis]|nr:IS1595 family transposase [Glaesserella parasuis]